MTHSRQINSLQLLSLLFVSRFFTMLVAVPNRRFALTGSDALLPPLFSALATAILILPQLFLTRSFPQQSLWEIAGQTLPKGRKLLLLWQLLLCLLTAVAAASQSEYFVSTALYPNAERHWVLFFFLLVVWYMSAMEVEALSRTALLVCGLIVLSFALIFAGVFREIDGLNLGPLFQDSAAKIGITTLAYWGQNMELILLWILQPYTEKPTFRRDIFVFLLGGFLLTEIITFFTTAVLGSYGGTRMFPVYTLAALSGHGFFSRLDYLHIINWNFACLLRCAMFATAAVMLLQDLFPKQKREKLRTGVMVSMGLAALLLTGTEGANRWFYQLFASGIPVGITVVLIPLILLLRSRKRVRE